MRFSLVQDQGQIWDLNIVMLDANTHKFSASNAGSWIQECKWDSEELKIPCHSKLEDTSTPSLLALLSEMYTNHLK